MLLFLIETRCMVSVRENDFKSRLRKLQGRSIKVCFHSVPFGEDACPIRLRNAALNFSLPRRAAMNLFRADHSRAMGLPRKRKAAAWSPDYLANILHLREI